MIPDWLIGGVSRQELEVILAHELAHLKRRDLLWSWLHSVVHCILFFHPLTWLAREEWNLAHESACDDLALAATSATVSQYGRVLLKVAARTPLRTNEEPVTACACQSVHILKRRLSTMSYPARNSGRKSAVLAAFTVFLAAFGLAPWRVLAQSPLTFAEYSIPSAGSLPSFIAAGPDGNLWFTEFGPSKIGMINTSGAITEFPITTPGCGPVGIAAGPDGNVWFTEAHANQIGRITPGGVITEFPIPTSNSYPYGIVAGGDGNLWFIESDGNKVGKISTGGAITEYSIPTTNSAPNFITAGPDGNLWFVESAANKIGRVTTVGTITEFTIPSPGSFANFIAAGPDGNLWFAEYGVNKIGRISTAGVFTEFDIPTANSIPEGIVAGPDGNMWFIEEVGNIASISATGTITEYPIPGGGGTPVVIATGTDGNLWFTEVGANRIGRAELLTFPTYAVKPLYDQTRAVKRGACYPVKVEVDNSAGANVSSQVLTVHAVSLAFASNNLPGTRDDVGNANPDNDFRFDATLGGYIFNLSTRDLYAGEWNLNFTIGDDPTIHTLQFHVK